VPRFNIRIDIQNATGADLRTIKRQLREVGVESRSTKEAIGGVGVSLGALRNVVSGIALGAVVREVVQLGSAYQQLRQQLVTLTGGDVGKAEAVFERLSDFAARTPFELQEVVRAHARLQAVGLRPTIGLLTSLGDTASANGRSLMQFAEAVADAATGEFERLKDFGVVARTQGEQVTFTFRGVATTVQKDSAAIVSYLEDIGRTDFAGGMERQSKTLEGALSNLRDSFALLSDAIFRSGIGEALTSVTRALAERVGEIARRWDELRGAVNDGIAAVLRGYQQLLEVQAKITSLNPFATDKAVAHLRGMAQEMGDLASVYEDFGREAARGRPVEDLGEQAEVAARQVDGVSTAVSTLTDRMERFWGVVEAGQGLELIPPAIDQSVVRGLLDRAASLDKGNEPLPFLIDPARVEAIRQNLIEVRRTAIEEQNRWAAEADLIAQEAGRDIAGRIGGAFRETFSEIVRTGELSFENLFNRLLDVFIDYLGEMLQAWIANQGAMAAASSSGLYGPTQSGGNIGGGGGYSSAGAALGIMAAAVAWVQAEKAKQNYTTGSLTLEGGREDIFASVADQFDALSEALRSIQDTVREVEHLTGGVLASLPKVQINVKKQGEVWAHVWDSAGTHYERVFRSVDEATRWVLATSLRFAEWGGISDDVRSILENADAAGGVEGVLEVLEHLREISTADLQPTTRELRDLEYQFDSFRQQLEELGASGLPAVMEFVGNLQDLRDQIVGVERDEYQERRAAAEEFNAELARIRGEYAAELARLAAALEMSARAAEVAADQEERAARRRSEANRAVGSRGGYETTDITPRGGGPQDLYPAGLPADIQREIDAIRELLGGLPEAIDPADIRRRDRRGQRQAERQAAQQEREQLRDELSGLLREGLGGEIEAARERFAELRERVTDAGFGAAELAEHLGTLAEAEGAALERLAAGVVGEVERFIAGNDIAAQVAALAEQTDGWRESLALLAEQGLITDEVLARLTAGLGEAQQAAQEQMRDDALGRLRGFGQNSDLLRGLNGMRRQAEEIGEELQALFEAGLISEEELEGYRRRLAHIVRRESQETVTAEAQSAVLYLLQALGRTKEAAEFSYKLKVAEMQVQLAELRIAEEKFGLDLDIVDEYERLLREFKEKGPPKPGDVVPPTLPGTGAGSYSEFITNFEQLLTSVRSFMGGGSQLSQAVAYIEQLESFLGGYRDGTRTTHLTQRQIDALELAQEQLLDFYLAAQQGGEGASAFAQELSRINADFEVLRDVFGDTAELTEAYNLALEALNERYLAGIRAFQESLQTSDLAPLTDRARLVNARSLFDEVANAALGGDVDALQRFPEVAQQLLELARGFFAGSTQYDDIFSLVATITDQLLGVDLVNGTGPNLAVFPGADQLNALVGGSATTNEQLFRLGNTSDQQLLALYDLRDEVVQLRSSVDAQQGTLDRLAADLSSSALRRVS